MMTPQVFGPRLGRATLLDREESAVASYWKTVRARMRVFGRLPRVMGVDVARGLAVIGMVGAHIGASEAFEWARVETWTDLVNGRSSTLFAIVAGVSIALMTGGRRTPAPGDLPRIRLRLLGRAAAVFIVGLVLEALGTGVSVILTVYAVVFVAVMPFLRWRRRSLILGSIALALAGPVLLAVAQVLTLAASGPGIDLVVFGTYPITVWMTFILAGLAVGRSNLALPRTALFLIAIGVASATVGYGAGELLKAPEPASSSSVGSGDSDYRTVPGEDIDLAGKECTVFDADVSIYCGPSQSGEGSEEGGDEPSYIEDVIAADPGLTILVAATSSSPHSGGILDILGSGGFGLAVLGACLLLARAIRPVLVPLAAVGSMPLTVYVAHVVSIIPISGVLEEVVDNSAWLAFSIGVIIACTLWAVLVGKGPLERLVDAAGRHASSRASTVPRG